MNKNATTQLHIYSAFFVLAGFVLNRGVFLLFLAEKGMSVTEIALYQALFNIATVVLELPTGLVGDFFGKKFHLLKVINLLIEYLGILSSANALAGRSTPLSAGSGAQACPDGQIHRPFGWFGVAGMPWRADQRLFGRFGGAGMP